MVGVVSRFVKGTLNSIERVRLTSPNVDVVRCECCFDFRDGHVAVMKN
ncbi:MAG: hypothetical protein ACI87E_002438, partial [Mariniblastus sp.]